MLESSSDEDVDDVDECLSLKSEVSVGYGGGGGGGCQLGASSNTSHSAHSGGSSSSPAHTDSYGHSRTTSFECRDKNSFDTVSINSGYGGGGGWQSSPAAAAATCTTTNGAHSRSGSVRSASSPRIERVGSGRDAAAAAYGSGPRAGSPSASVASEREREELEKQALEEEDRRKRLQIYVFVLRCVAFPFNAKQPQDMQKRQAKVSKQDLQKVKERFAAFLSGKTAIMADEALKSAVQSYYEVFLKSDRVASMVRSGACSANDFRDVFKNNIEKRVRSLPEIDGLSKETVLSSWMAKFDAVYRGEDGGGGGDYGGGRGQSRTVAAAAASELILSKEQLYEMFQNILGIKKNEHLMLYNALQLDNPDEQAAQVRRELDSRLKQIANIQKTRNHPRFVFKEMELMYIDELRAQVSQLKSNLESVPVKGVGSLTRNAKKNNQQHNPIASMDPMDHREATLSKPDVVLTFKVAVVVNEVKGLKLANGKQVFCTMEVEGCDKLQTAPADASKPFWRTQGDFETAHALPQVKVKLFEERSGLLSMGDKELGKVIIKPMVTSSKQSEWHKMMTSKEVSGDLQIKITVHMESPQNLKRCGYLYALGRSVWRKAKRRYFVLVQVSQYTFAMCSYHERKSDPTEMLQLNGYAVDYCDPVAEMEGGKYFFHALRPGDDVLFATDDEPDRHGWVQALYRATGQSNKPTPPTAVLATTNDLPSVPSSARIGGESEGARKHGLIEFVSADSAVSNHADYFHYLQRLTLDYRMNDAYTCLGWLSPGQIFILDEYAARYGVRGCHRHLCYLGDLLAKAESDLMIDPALMHYSFAFCASHVFGNKPDGLGTITVQERNKYEEIKERLRKRLEHQITHFRYSFPFGRPEGALKATLSLLERVLMKDLACPVGTEEVRSVVKKCLENAALVNYTRISEYASIEDARNSKPEETYGEGIQSEERLDRLLHLAELCIEVLQQNEEHHAEEFRSAFAWFNDLLVEHNELFWSLFSVDMDAALDVQPPDTWDSFPLFQLLNSYLLSDRYLCGGRFHCQLRDKFAPQVVRYVDLMEMSIGQSIHKGFARERWEQTGGASSAGACTGSGGVGGCCSTAQDVLWKLSALQAFISGLQWPDEVFAEHLDHRLKLMASDMIEATVKRTAQAFDLWLQRGSTGTDYTIPPELCVMVNTVIECKVQAATLCIMDGEAAHKYHTQIDDFLDGVQRHMMDALLGRLLAVLDGILSKLKRYDEGTFFSSLLSLAKPTDELGKTYVSFLRVNLDLIRQKTTDEIFVNTVFERWYSEQMKRLCQWLTDRLDTALHPYQLTCLIHMVRKCYSDFELQGVPESELNSRTYQTTCGRLQVEEATHAVMESRATRPVSGIARDDE